MNLKIFSQINNVPLLHRSLCRRFSTKENLYLDKIAYTYILRRHFSKEVIKVPALGDSITEGTLNHWKKNVGDYIRVDETVAVIDTDKVSVDINAKVSGMLSNILANAGDIVLVDSPICEVDTSAQANENQNQSNEKTQSSNEKTQESNEQIKEKKVDSGVHVEKEKKITGTKVEDEKKKEPQPTTSRPIIQEYQQERSEKRVRMIPIRKRIAERLKESQNTAALLTTFNECDMSKAMLFRNELKEIFQTKYGCKLGFVSLFMYASTLALLQMPIVNACIENDEIVYKNYVDISVAVATSSGLTVPVIRNCQNKKLHELELALSDLASKARSNKLSIQDFVGGTFTISNGGVFGSMLSTPIVNMPQSAILGMHTIKNRPVVVNNEIVIRPIMYLALTYDHRLLDGREAVQFLCLIRDYIENPNLLITA